MNITPSTADEDLRAAIGVPASAARVVLHAPGVAGVTLAVAREGRGRPVVCLHATGHGGGDYAALARALAGEYEVIRLDWPGQGRSGPDPVAASGARYGALLTALLDQLGIERPILIGNSIGGAAAIHYASVRPVRALVLCDSAGLLRIGLLSRAAAALGTAFFAAGARGAGWFERAFALYYRKLVLPRAAASAQRERIIAASYALAPVIRDAWRSFGQPEADLRQLARALEVPVWAAWARDDRVVPLWLCRPALARMKRVSIDVFEAGHAAFLEQPEAFLAGFRAFVARELSAADAAGPSLPTSA